MSRPPAEIDAADPPVIVYGSPGCRHTERAQARLEELGVEYRRVEITALDNPVATLRSLVGDQFTTPIIAVGDQARVGLDPDWLAARLQPEREPDASPSATGPDDAGAQG